MIDLSFMDVNRLGEINDPGGTPLRSLFEQEFLNESLFEIPNLRSSTPKNLVKIIRNVMYSKKLNEYTSDLRKNSNVAFEGCILNLNKMHYPQQKLDYINLRINAIEIIITDYHDKFIKHYKGFIKKFQVQFNIEPISIDIVKLVDKNEAIIVLLEIIKIQSNVLNSLYHQLTNIKGNVAHSSISTTLIPPISLTLKSNPVMLTLNASSKEFSSYLNMMISKDLIECNNLKDPYLILSKFAIHVSGFTIPDHFKKSKYTPMIGDYIVWNKSLDLLTEYFLPLIDFDILRVKDVPNITRTGEKLEEFIRIKEKGKGFGDYEPGTFIQRFRKNHANDKINNNKVEIMKNYFPNKKRVQ